jgi:hypothetical protein
LASRRRAGLRARRLWCAGYAASAVVAVYLVSDRPHVALWPVVVVAAADAVVGLVGYVARCRAAASVHERARLQWPAWAVVVAIAISLTAWVLHELVSWPEPIRAVVVSTTVLVPLSLALGASSASRCASTGSRAHHYHGLRRWWRRHLLIVRIGGRRPATRRPPRLSMLRPRSPRRSGSRCASDSPTSPRAAYGERHAPDEVLRTFGGSRALPLDELLLQLAESLKKTMALSVAEVDAGSGVGSSAVSCPIAVREPRLGSEEETVVARAGVSGSRARIWLPRSSILTTRCCGSRRSPTAASCWA